MLELDELTSDQIGQIRVLSLGTTQEQVAEAFDVSLATVRACQDGNWNAMSIPINEMRLTAHDVKEIAKSKDRAEWLAERYNVTEDMIRQVQRGDKRVGVLDTYEGPERRGEEL